MRLIPPTIAESTKSDGERAVFEALAASGPDTAGWTVLHSFDIADHRRRLAGEIDFLCLVPGKGVLVVEVKGCHSLRRHGGDWYYGHSAEPDHRGPFRQASEAMHSLRQRLARQHPELAGIPFWSAVCFPFIDFTETSPEWHSWQVIDRRALQAQPIARLIEGRARPGAQAAGRAPASGWFHPETGRAHAAPVRRAGRPAAPRLRVLREPQVASAAARARRCATTPRSSSRRWTRSTPTRASSSTGRPAPARRCWPSRPRGAPSAAGAACCCSASTGRSAAGCRRRRRDLGRGVTARTLHEHLRLLADIAPTREQRCRQEFWQEELPAHGPRGAARARGQARLLRRDRARRGPGRAAPQLPRRARPEPARRARRRPLALLRRLHLAAHLRRRTR